MNSTNIWYVLRTVHTLPFRPRSRNNAMTTSTNHNLASTELDLCFSHLSHPRNFVLQATTAGCWGHKREVRGHLTDFPPPSPSQIGKCDRAKLVHKSTKSGQQKPMRYLPFLRGKSVALSFYMVAMPDVAPQTPTVPIFFCRKDNNNHIAREAGQLHG
jgi:hypothetical protein